MRFGQALRVFRTAADVGLRELARKVGVSPAYLSLVETGKLGPPSGSRLAQIARALAIPPGALMNITGRTDPAVLHFLQEVPETSDLVRAVMDLGLSASEIRSFSRALGGGRREAVRRILAAFPGGNGSGGGAKLLDHLGEEMVFPSVPCRTRDELFGFVAAAVAERNPSLDRESLTRLLLDRESDSSTALGEGVAVPHARVPGLARATVVLARRARGIEYPGAEGKPVRLVFLLLSSGEGSVHLELLADIAELINRPRVVSGLLGARGRQGMIALLKNAGEPAWRDPVESPGEPAKGAGAKEMWR